MFIPEQKIWLEQFNKSTNDKVLAKALLEKLLYLEASEVKLLINNLIFRDLKSTEQSAIFVERELPITKNPLPPAMYKEEKVSNKKNTRKKSLRAAGAAQQAVKSLKYNRQVIGSEGVLAQFLSSLCHKWRGILMFQPSAEEIRKCKVRQIVIVTDFIGSGDRIHNMLSSFWRVRSIRSWNSYKLIKLVVISVTGTNTGIKKVMRHPSKPTVITAFDCPTIFNSFGQTDTAAVKDLCLRYGKFHSKPLGYGEIGALVAFEHSAPNNMPAIFIRQNNSNSKPWSPLFIDRSTESYWGSKSQSSNSLSEKFEAIGLKSIYDTTIYKSLSAEIQRALLVVAAISKNRRHIVELISTTGMPVKFLFFALDRATELGWITNKQRMTEVGRAVISDLVSRSPHSAVAFLPAIDYYPLQLRAPI